MRLKFKGCSLVYYMPKNFQPCYYSKFNLIGDSIDRAQNLDMKVPSGFEQIHKNRTNLAPGIGVKTQPYVIPSKFSSNIILPQSLYGNLTKSPYSGYPKNLDAIYQLGYENEKPDLLPLYTCKGLNGPNLVSCNLDNESSQFSVKTERSNRKYADFQGNNEKMVKDNQL